MTSKTFAEISTEIDTLIPDNTNQEVSASDLRTVLNNLTDSCFRSEAIAKEDLTGRILLEQGGYLLKEG